MVRFDFSGKTVLVTGGSSGIGHTTALTFRDAGADVHTTGTRPQETYDGDLSGMTFHCVDFGEEGVLANLAAALPALDVLVNNAGMVLYKRQEFDPENFRRVLDVNLTAMMTLAGLLRPKLAAAPGGGAIVNLASVTAYFGSRGNPAYGASKAAIVQLTKTLAVAWACDSIRVNAVAPGFVATKMTEVSQNGPINDGIIARTPLRRWGKPAEIAAAILFLASDAAGFVSGETLTVDGGFSCNL